jgi:cytochrome c oxidase assembly protein subunit 11
VQEESNKNLKTRKIVFLLTLLTIGMFGFGYALVPIYNVLCKSLGINGKTNTQSIGQASAVDKNRTVTVQFLATNNSNLPWQFRPKTWSIKVHPGENTRISYYAKNETNHAMIVQAIPSVTPGLAARHLKKTECFCFTQQTLLGGQAMDMPILFHIDRDLPENVRTVTLSYTLFDVTKTAQQKQAAKNKQGHL